MGYLLRKGFPVFLAVAMFLTVLSSVLAQNVRPPTFTTVPSGLAATYDVNGATVITATLSISARQAGYALGVTTGSSGTYSIRRMRDPLSGAELEYQLRTEALDGMVLTDLDGISGGRGPLTGFIRGNSTVDLTFDLIAVQGQWTRAGTYSDTVSLKLYSPEDGSGGLQQERALPISITVPRFLSLSVVDSGGLFDPAQDTARLDFGTLETGKSLGVDLLVRGSVDYTVSVRSANRGRLAMLAPSDGSTVPYTMTVNSVVHSLAGESGAVISQGSGPTRPSGNRYPLFFTIGEIRDATSGDYADDLTITVTAR
jgi:spore coat protein U-like protein